MGNESGTWIMREATSQVSSSLEHLATAATEKHSFEVYGVAPDDPECIHTVDEAIEYINEIGFMPLFKNEIPGFSLEEHTVAEHWWSENPDIDPWEWRVIISRRGEVAYGKFFDGKAGFISREWLPYFVNYRRDGYDFDALWDDGKASRRQKKIMDLFAEENEDAELYSNEIKQNAGFGREGEKGFEGTITNLQHMMYLCVRDFRKKKNIKGREYGWAIAVYATPEHIFGYEQVTAVYSENPLDSGKKIAMHIMDVYPIASASQIKKLIGLPVGAALEKKKVQKKVNYPQNLLTALKTDIKNPSEDQILGLEFALGQLKEAEQGVLSLHYEKGLTYNEIGIQTGRSGSRCGSMARRAILRLQRPNRLAWIIEGYKGRLTKINEQAEEARKQFIAEGRTELANLMLQSPDTLNGITARHASLLMNVGIGNIGVLREAMKDDFWTRQIPGVGEETGKKLVYAMYRAGIIDDTFEAYKETDREYYLAKCVR